MAEETSEVQEKALLVTKSKRKVKLEEIPVRTGAAGNESTQIIARGKHGKFVSKGGTKIDPRTITLMFREAMLKTNTETGFSDLQEFYLALAEIIKIPLTDSDPKAAMAAVKAYEALMSRVWGKPDVSDDELAARASSGVKVLILNQAPAGKKLEKVEEVKKLPSFADAEVISTNPK